MPVETKRSAGRPMVKREQILRHLRDQIVAGTLPPGARLPTRRELSESFKASLITVQQALDRLVRDGFIGTRGKAGTFVLQRPAHLFNYAVVFPDAPGGENWPRFWTALANEVQRLQYSGERTVHKFFGVNGHADSEDFQNLTRAIEAHRLAGVIFAASPHELEGTPVLEMPGLPRVAIMGAARYPQVPAVVHAGNMIDNAVEYLASRGRKRLALLTVPSLAADRFKEEVARRGLETRPYWIQTGTQGHPESVRELVHLLMNDQQQVRPDGLIIADDNLVEYATIGLVSAGIQVPRDMEVVGHCNFPWPTPALLPIKRLGYDARATMRICVDLIDRQRRGEAVPAVTPLPTVWEEQLEAVSG